MEQPKPTSTLNVGDKKKDEEEPEEWEHPLFMTALPSGEHPEKDTLDAISNLITEDETPEGMAEHFKERGNKLLSQGKKYYEAALESYTQDCRKALEFNPANVKALYRAAKAANCLEKFEDAAQYARKALELEPDNRAVQTELKKSEEIKARIENRNRRRQKEQAEKEKRELQLLSLVESRGVTMGKPVFNTQAYRSQASSTSSTSGEGSGSLTSSVSEAVKFDPENGQLVWSVLFIYEEFGQTDFVQEFYEEASFTDVLAMMFPSMVVSSPTGEPVSRAPWDTKGDYLVENMCVYFESNWTISLKSWKQKKLQKKNSTDAAGGANTSTTSNNSKKKSGPAGGSGPRAEDKAAMREKRKFKYGARKKHKVDIDTPLKQALAHSKYVVPGIPVFYIVTKRFEREFLARDLSFN